MHKLLFIITALLLFSANTILAADCLRSNTLSDELKSAAAVFSGKVVAQERRKITDAASEDFGGERLFIKFKVDRWWKGSGNDEIALQTSIVYFAGTIRQGSEDFRFASEGSYLVYAYFYNGEFGTNVCARTKKLSEATEELKELGEGFPPKTAQNCPDFTIFTKSEDYSTNIWIYSVRFENLDPKLKLTYKWTYLRGAQPSEIKSGQGTTLITIDKVDLYKGITVWLEVGGLPTGCDNKTGQSVIS